MQVFALGPIEVRIDGREANLGGPKPKALLAALLLQPRQPVSIDRLVTLIWDESPPQSAVALVHTYTSQLRRGFASLGVPSALVTRAPGYLLDMRSDLEDFQRLLDSARRAEREDDHAAAASRYAQAIALWRGPAFGGVDTAFTRTWAAGLDESRLSAEEGLARCELMQGKIEEAMTQLVPLSANHPLREEVRGLMMRALYTSGRQAEALAVYRDAREHMLAELGIEPSEKLRELHSQVLNGTIVTQRTPVRVAEPRRATQKPRVTVVEHGVPQHLPPDIGDFTGRDDSLRRVLQLAEHGRDSGTATPTVVISGFGGAGKSALAVHAAHLLRASYPDGQLFADLRGADRDLGANEVVGRFLGALGVSTADLPDTLDERVGLYRMRVADQRLVIVLDNARNERQVRQLLPGNPHCLVIITSRSRLTGIEGAEPVELDFIPTAGSVEMLSRIVGPGRVAAEPEAAETIAHLCGGVPLAIRAAAAKLLARPHWPLRALAGRLSNERRRLDELAVGDLAIRSSLRLNYAELDDLHRRAFHLLSLLDLPDFGSWVAAPLLDVPLHDAEDIVEQLVDLRLLEVSGVDVIGRVRYRFHDLVQLFGTEQAAIGEPAELVTLAVSRALAAWMVLVEKGAERLPRVTLGLHPSLTADIDLDPLLVDEVAADPTGWLKAETAAIVRAIERANELGIGEMTTTLITSLLSSPFAARGEFEGWQRTHEVALVSARSTGNERAEAVLLTGLGQMFYEKDDFSTALQHFEQAARHASAVGDDSTLAVALVGNGTVRRDLAQFDEAQEMLRQAVRLAEPAADRSVIAAANYGLGAISRDRGEFDVAVASFNQCVEQYRALRDKRGEALALRGLSLCHRACGEYRMAAEQSQLAEQILEETGDHLGAAYARQSLAKARIREAKLAGVAEMLASSLDFCDRHRDRFGVALITRTLGELALAQGQFDEAHKLLTSALELWTTLQLPLWRARTLRDLATVEAASDPESADVTWQKALGLFAESGGREAAELAGMTPLTWLDHVRKGHL